MASFHGTKIDPSRFDRSQIAFLLWLGAIAAFMLLPMVYIFSHALKPIDELFLYPPRFLVQKPTMKNFVDLFRETSVSVIPMTRYLFNSVVVTTATVAGTVIVSSMAGFALSKLDFRLKKVLFEANILALMFVPAAVTIPRYLIVQRLGLTDNMLGHILPLLALPVGVFLVKQFVDQVPDALLEAAAIDGAGPFQMFRWVVVPVIRPAIATVAILAFQMAWNNAETSEIYMNKEPLKTLAFYVSTLSGNVENQVAGQGVAAAAALLMFIPNLVIFLVMQSKVMDTMAHSGLK